jgi:hypothetical protein
MECVPRFVRHTLLFDDIANIAILLAVLVAIQVLTDYNYREALMFTLLISYQDIEAFAVHVCIFAPALKRVHIWYQTGKDKLRLRDNQIAKIGRLFFTLLFAAYLMAAPGKLQQREFFIGFLCMLPLRSAFVFLIKAGKLRQLDAQEAAVAADCEVRQALIEY